jgi:hypothetical protein
MNDSRDLKPPVSVITLATEVGLHVAGEGRLFKLLMRLASSRFLADSNLLPFRGYVIFAVDGGGCIIRNRRSAE